MFEFTDACLRNFLYGVYFELQDHGDCVSLLDNDKQFSKVVVY